jgi:acyl-coenzyme A synthetase/AMP-(fatty) acid ligase
VRDTVAIRPAWRVNVAEVLLDANVGARDRSAIRFPGGEWSYDELTRRVGRFTAELRARGVVPGDRIVLALPDGPMWVVAFLAVMRVGAVAAFVPQNLSHERRMDAVLRAYPTLVIANEPGVWAEGPVFIPSASDGATDLGDETAATRGDDPAYLLLTSGSTGPPKWALHRQRDIPVCLRTYGRHVLRLRPGDVTYSTASLASSYGLGNSLYFPLGAGACAWIDGERASPAGAATACREGGVTVLLGVPTFWARLARHVADGRVDASAFHRVRLAVSAGEPLGEAVWDAVEQTLGLELVDGLGSSEASNLYLSNRPGTIVRGTVGRVVPGFDVMVCDATGARVSPGEVGELVVRGGSVMQGYLGDELATRRALVDGWLHTGDLVAENRDGTYRFVGRLGDRFKSSGLWVDPHRVAAALLDDPRVTEAYVAGVADPAGVVRVAAVVASPTTDDPELPRALIARAGSHLARHEIPWSVAVVSELPTAPSGKMRRDEADAIAARALAREVRGGD